VATDLIELALGDVGEYFARYRLRAPAMERALEASLRRYGHMSPVVVFRWRDRYELVDGQLADGRAATRRLKPSLPPALALDHAFQRPPTGLRTKSLQGRPTMAVPFTVATAPPPPDTRRRSSALAAGPA
jgi:hypothetical protein